MGNKTADSIYTTNHPDIVAHAKECVKKYPTIVNNIPKEKSVYSLSLENYAMIDNNLMKCQSVIGESSNLAQICLTYTYNFDDRKYYDYTCILAVVAQISIDSAKRKFDIDLDSEMDRIKNDINVKENGLPLFWQLTKKDKRKCSSASERSKRQKQNLESIKSKINPDLVCPMNYLYNINLRKFRSSTSTLPMKHFFINYPAEADRRKSKQIEELIEKYSLEIYDTNINYTTININYEEDHMDMILEDDLEELINDISQIRMSGSYRGMMSWLINRALMIGTGVRQNAATVSNNTDRNRPVLMKVLYKSNPKVFLECFKKSLYT